MARARKPVSAEASSQQIKWMQIAIFVMVALVLAAVIWALYTVAAINRAGPRSALERELRAKQAIVETYPDSPVAWADYITLQAQAGRIAAARRTVDEADAVFGKRVGPVATASARIAFIAGDYEDARDGVEEALSIVDAEIEAEKIRNAEKAVLANPDMSTKIDALILQAEILEQLGDFEGVVNSYAGALELDPTMADVLVARALALEKLGRIDEALADVQAALVFIPDYEPALQVLERLQK
ncbi:MAG: hypothetical protein EG823_01665 [Actinobacteria bacterium]|nr:hypothetical protein [Actinomycetota bacterium]